MIIRRALRTTRAQCWREAKRGERKTLLDTGDVFWRHMAITDWFICAVFIGGASWAAFKYRSHKEDTALLMQSSNPYSASSEGRNLGDLSAMQLYRLEQDAKYILKRVDETTPTEPIEAERRD